MQEKIKTQMNTLLSYNSEVSTQPITQAYLRGSCYCMTVGMTVKKGMCQVELPILSMAGFNILMCFITTVWAR